MVIKVYISNISASTEIKSYQQRAQFILDSLQVDYESVDITDPGHEEDKEMIKEKCKHRNNQPPKTPQFFNDDTYCGDWYDFEEASDEDRVLEWLGLDPIETNEPEPVAEMITGTDTDTPATNEPQVVRKETVTWDGNDKIITEEIVTKEEQIVFGNQTIRTAPEYVKIDTNGAEEDDKSSADKENKKDANDESESAQQDDKKHVIKDTVEMDTGDKEVEEETCFLEVPSANASKSASPEPISDLSDLINSESFEKIEHDELDIKSQDTDLDTRPNSALSEVNDLPDSDQESN